MAFSIGRTPLLSSSSLFSDSATVLGDASDAFVSNIGV
jgi:hypothetical protein